MSLIPCLVNSPRSQALAGWPYSDLTAQGPYQSIPKPNVKLSPCQALKGFKLQGQTICPKNWIAAPLDKKNWNFQVDVGSSRIPVSASSQ